MSIPNPLIKIKDLREKNQDLTGQTVRFTEDGHIKEYSLFKNYFVAILFVLVSILSFGVGKLSQNTRSNQINISYDPSLSALVASTTNVVEGEDINNNSTDEEVFASSKGKRFYYPGCGNNISEANKITFKNKELAMAAGYTLALNCKLK